MFLRYDLEELLDELLRQVQFIESKLDNPCSGLIALREQVQKMLDRLSDPHTGLPELKSEVEHVRYSLTNPECGLARIYDMTTTLEGILGDLKSDVRNIEEKLDSTGMHFPRTLTTGPVVADNSANSVVVAIKNNTVTTRTIQVNLIDVGTCPNPQVIVSSASIIIPPRCCQAYTFGKPPIIYEVQFQDMRKGLYAWTSTRLQAQLAPLSASTFIATNTFRHNQLIPICE